MSAGISADTGTMKMPHPMPDVLLAVEAAVVLRAQFRASTTAVLLAARGADIPVRSAPGSHAPQADKNVRARGRQENA